MGLAAFIGAALNRLRKPASDFESTEDPRHRLGREGERLAAEYLRAHGFKVLYRNFRARKGGEVDIVCRERATNTLVFTEVKTRSSLQWGDPALAVNREKQWLITRGAMAWLRLLDNPDIMFRFDILEVLSDGKNAVEFNLIQNAFQLPDPYVY